MSKKSEVEFCFDDLLHSLESAVDHAKGIEFSGPIYLGPHGRIGEFETGIKALTYMGVRFEITSYDSKYVITHIACSQDPLCEGLVIEAESFYQMVDKIKNTVHRLVHASEKISYEYS